MKLGNKIVRKNRDFLELEDSYTDEIDDWHSDICDHQLFFETKVRDSKGLFSRKKK